MYLLSKAQVDDCYFQNNNNKTIAGLNGSYEFVSNSISKKFLNNYLFGSRIDSMSKQWMFAGLRPNNRLGGDIEGGLSYLTFPDTLLGFPDMGLFFKYNKYYHIDMSFTRDLAELLFDGNKRFAGSTAYLDNSSLNIINYEQLQVGILTKFGNDKTKQTFGIGVSLNNGYNNINIDIAKGSLYTDANAEYLDFAANYKVSRSSASKAFNGIGSSMNIYYSIEGEKKNCFKFELTDLGFIRWNSQSQQFSKDTAIHFEGINVSDILNIQGNVFGNANADSIVHTYTYATTTKAYYMMTPAVLMIFLFI